MDGLFVEVPESCLVNCVAECSFLDAFATLYFRRSEISLRKVREMGDGKEFPKRTLEFGTW